MLLKFDKDLVAKVEKGTVNSFRQEVYDNFLSKDVALDLEKKYANMSKDNLKKCD